MKVQVMNSKNKMKYSSFFDKIKKKKRAKKKTKNMPLDEYLTNGLKRERADLTSEQIEGYVQKYIDMMNERYNRTEERLLQAEKITKN